MITGIILTKNEEKVIEKCIKSLFFCDKVLVVDDNSSDKTVEISKRNKAQVITHPLNGDFAVQRNFALSQVKTEWALFVDADEIVTPQLAAEVKSSMFDKQSNGYYIKRQDELFGRTLRYGELLNKKFVRLGRVGIGKWDGKVHETWNIKGKVITLENPLIHKPHQTIIEFISEVNYYSSLRAEELYKSGVRASSISIIFYTFFKFMHVYVVKFGFADGIPGLILSLIMTLHTFLVRGKLYILQQGK